MVGDDPGAQPERNLLSNADVTPKLGDSVRYEAFGLKSRLTGSVEAIEQPGIAKRAREEINLVDGHYKDYGKELRIEYGKVILGGRTVTESERERRGAGRPEGGMTGERCRRQTSG